MHHKPNDDLYSRPDIGVVSSELVGSSVVAVARNPWVDGLRVAAAVGIVWFHARAPEAEFAYSGLSVFLIMTFYFEARRSGAASLSGLAARYLIPWAFWFLFYGFAHLAVSEPFLRNYGANVSLLATILAGTSIHLWYLPFVFVFLVALRMALNTPVRDIAFPLAATALLIYIATARLWLAAATEMGPPIGQYAQALPAVLTGVALGAANNSSGARAVIALLVVALAVAGLTVSHQFGLQDALAATLFIVALFLGKKPLARNLSFGLLPALTYGVYLIHPIFLDLSKSTFPQDRPQQAIFAAVAAFLATWVIRRYGGRFAKAIT